MGNKRQREEPCYICNHYHNYEGGEQCKSCGHVLHTAQIPVEQIRAMPSEILPSFLYLGSYDHASRMELLRAMGITHVLSVVSRSQNLYRNSFTYHTTSTSPADFQECFDFIDDVKNKQSRVLVHCMTGTTRSCEVVIAYLIKLRGWSFQESFQWVKDRHKTCVLNPAEVERLQAFEQQALGQAFSRPAQPGVQQGGSCPGSSVDCQTSQAGLPQDLSGQQCNGPTFGFMQPPSSNERFVFGAK